MASDKDKKEIISDLNDLIHLDYDAIAAYRAAIERLDDAASKKMLAEFMGDHEKHVEALSEAVRTLGGDPPTKGGAMKVLTKGKVVIAGLLGDKALLTAMKANEVVTNTKYEAATEAGYPEPIQKIVRGGLADERRHKNWLDKTLEGL